MARQFVFDHTDLLKLSAGSLHQESVIIGNEAMFTTLILQIIISFLKLLSSLSAHGSKMWKSNDTVTTVQIVAKEIFFSIT